MKMTVHGFSWNETVDRLRRCLQNFVIAGPKTTIPFYLNIAKDEDFIAGDFDTSYLDKHPELFEYDDNANEASKLANLIAEIHHRGQNPYAA